MVSPGFLHFSPSSPMPRLAIRNKSSSLLPDATLFAGGALSALLIMWALSCFTNPSNNPPTSLHLSTDSVKNVQDCANPNSPTFYDDPHLSYTIGDPVTDWDTKRQQWMHRRFQIQPSSPERILLVTGSQPSPCKNPIGDHLLLRSFKNKVDYCRIHNCDVFYNNALLHPKMDSFWAKIPIVRAAMVAHPESEWIWWMDSDAIITDMDFKLPLQKYSHYNLIVHGWKHLVYDHQSWTSLNAGVFLLRNCDWTMQFLEAWAKMGPQSPDFARWGSIQRSMLKDKLFPASDDQAALIYLLIKEREKWADRIYLEKDYFFEGYWVKVLKALDNATVQYTELEKGVRRLRRRHAEVEVGECYSALRDVYLAREGVGYGEDGRRRPFVAHFTGCQPCSGNHNQIYDGEECWRGMTRALDFGDDQVLRSFGYVHGESGVVKPRPFDFPA